MTERMTLDKALAMIDHLKAVNAELADELTAVRLREADK